MVLADHLFVLVLAVLYPVAGYFGFRRLLRQIAAGAPVDRTRLYRMTIAGHAVLFGVALAICAVSGRRWSALGLGFAADGAFLAGALVTGAVIALLWRQLRRVSSAGAAEISRLRQGLGTLEAIIPHNAAELRRFHTLSITAGIVEELLWRGYLIWYLAAFMPLLAAASLSAIGFGAAHAYQGIANLPRITFVGFALAALYLLCGSLWLPMILHAAVDILQGRLAFAVVTGAGARTVTASRRLPTSSD